jgi:hypothetical protein
VKTFASYIGQFEESRLFSSDFCVARELLFITISSGAYSGSQVGAAR